MPKTANPLDILYNAFLPYITAHPDFDILYSPKAGYIWSMTAPLPEPPKRLRDVESMMGALVLELYSDVVGACSMSKIPSVVRRKVVKILSSVDDVFLRDEFLAITDSCLKRYR